MTVILSGPPPHTHAQAQCAPTALVQAASLWTALRGFQLATQTATTLARAFNSLEEESGADDGSAQKSGAQKSGAQKSSASEKSAASEISLSSPSLSSPSSSSSSFASFAVLGASFVAADAAQSLCAKSERYFFECQSLLRKLRARFGAYHADLSRSEAVKSKYAFVFDLCGCDIAVVCVYAFS